VASGGDVAVGCGEGPNVDACDAGGKIDVAPTRRMANVTARTGANSSFFLGKSTIFTDRF